MWRAAPPPCAVQVTDKGITTLGSSSAGLKLLKLNYCVQLTDTALYYLSGAYVTTLYVRCMRGPGERGGRCVR